MSRWFALALLLAALVPIPAAATPLFTDVSDAAGLSGPLYNSYVHAGAWGDVDGDGWPDLFAGTFEQGPTVVVDQLLMNAGGVFVDSGQAPVELIGRAAAAVFADLDNDGDDDLVVSNNTKTRGSAANLEPSHLLRNDSGTYVDVTAGSGLAAQNKSGRQVGVLDHDGDGLLDLFIVGDYFGGGGPTVLLRNDGDLRFTDVTAAVGIPTDVHGLGLAIGDVTGDRWPDIFVAGGPAQGDANRNYLFVANGDGTYRSVVDHGLDWTGFANGNEDWVSAGALGDVDIDGDLDLLVGHHFGSSADQGVGAPLRLYLNQGVDGQGDPVFEDVTAAVGLPNIVSKAPHVEIQDFDNDGLPDLFTSVTVGGQPVIFYGTGVTAGLPGFAIPPLAEPHYYPVGPVADFDLNGTLDVFLGEFRSVNQGGPNDEGVVPSLLLANTGSSLHWLEVGIDAPGRGVGAQVSVYREGEAGMPAGLLGHGQIQLGNGFSSAGLPVAHFGLGGETIVDVVVAMPHTGDTIVVASVAADQRLAVPVDPGPPDPPDPPAGPEPEAWWPLDEPSGVAVADVSGNGHDGTLVGSATRVPGAIGGAVSLGGQGSRAEVPPAPMDGAEAATVSVWLSTTSLANQTLVGAAGGGDSDAFDVRLRRGTKLEVTPGAGGRRLTWSVPNLADGAWHHVAIVRDGGTGEITVYVDGASQGTVAVVLSPLAVTHLGFGADQTAPGSFSSRNSLTGAIDDIRIYREALSAAEIQVLAGA